MKENKFLFLIFILAGILVWFFYDWNTFFYDGIYYLRTVSNPKLFTPSFTLGDRWTHVHILWILVKLTKGPSAISFHLIHDFYRVLMVLSMFVWWRVFIRFWPDKKARLGGLFFLLTSPCTISGINQILPEQWAFIFHGVAFLFYFQGIERKRVWCFPLSGFFFYLGFLSRSDSLMLSGVLWLGRFIWSENKKEEMKGIALTGLVFIPFFAWHIYKIGGFANINPMGKAMWDYRQGKWDRSIKECWRAGGIHWVFLLFTYFASNKKETRMLLTSLALIYAVYLFWIFTGHFAYGRHTYLGVMVLTAAGTLGFVEAQKVFSRVMPQKMFWCFILAILIPFHVWAANRMNGGVDIDKAKKIFNQVVEKPETILLVSDDPTFYFFKYYFSDRYQEKVFLCFADGDTKQIDYYRSALKAQLGSDYAANVDEINRYQPKEILLLGEVRWSWLQSLPALTADPADEYGIYKGVPVRRLSFK